MDVSEYPVSDEVYGTGMGNPNVSYYTYSATITDKSVQVTEDDWLSVNIQGGTDNSGVIVLDKAFVRTENGAYYVYKEENGVLKKAASDCWRKCKRRNVCNCKRRNYQRR